MAPDVPVEVFVNVTIDPGQTDKGVPVNDALSPHPVKVIAVVFVLPTQEAAVVSVTAMFPLAVPNVTVIWLLFGPAAPAVIVAPAGTVHA